MTACYTPYAFTVQVLDSLSIAKATVPLMLFAYGLGAVAGNIISGTATDRCGGAPVLVIAYMVMTTTLGALAWLSLAASYAPPVAVAVLMALWGASSWAQTPAQQHRLIAAAPSEASIVVALNSAGIYLGIATGTAIGSIGIGVGVTAMITCGAALSFVALVYAAGTSRW
jgi:DHA1 family inner membrane transport protein